MDAIHPTQNSPTAGSLAHAGLPPASNLQDASQKFEAVLLGQFLGKALQPLLSKTPESGGGNAHIYQYLTTRVLSESLAEREVFGFASLLQQQLASNAGGEDSPSQQTESEHTLTLES